MKLRKGFTFIEVIVSVFILSLIISGMSSMETGNIRIGTSGKYGSQANGIGQEGINLVKAVSDKIHLAGTNPALVDGQCVDPGHLAKCPANLYYIDTTSANNGKIFRCTNRTVVNGKNICLDTGADVVIDNKTFKRSISVPTNLDTRIYVSWDEKGVTKVSEFRLFLAGAAIGVVESLPGPSVTLVANPDRVNSGGSSVLTWTTANATSCTASGDPNWIGLKSLAGGSETMGNITTNKTYTLTCTSANGQTATASATVTVITVGCTGTYIYDSANFIGVQKELPVGDYNADAGLLGCSPKAPIAIDGDSTGLCEDTISSIKVGSGCYVFAFDSKDFIRTTMIPILASYDFANFVSDVANLSTTNVDDKISSLKVVNASDYPVSVYTATNYGGTNAYLPIGNQDQLSLTTTYGLPLSTSRISSVKVTPGHSVTLYEDNPHTTGAAITFTSDAPTLGAFDTIETKSLVVN